MFFLGDGLRTLAGVLSTDQAGPLAERLVARMEEEMDSDRLRALADSLVPVLVGLDASQLTELLKLPTFARNSRTYVAVLGDLQNRGGRTALGFTNSVWNYVSWMSTNRNHPAFAGVDLASPYWFKD